MAPSCCGGHIVENAQDLLEENRTSSMYGALFTYAITIFGATALSYVFWRWAEATRARNITRHEGAQVLPSPAALLPRWLGFFGGHTLLLKPTKMTQQMEDWANELGGDYELDLFGRHLVAVSSLADVRRMLMLRPSKFRRGLASTRTKWAGRQLEVIPSMFFDEGKEWGRSRRLLSPHLNAQNANAMLPIIAKIGERLCAKMEARAAAGEAVDAKDHFARYTHDIIALAAFGVDVDCIRASNVRPCASFDAVESALSGINSLSYNYAAMIQWTVLGTAVPWIRQAKTQARKLGTIVQDAIDAARREMDRRHAEQGIDAAQTASAAAPGNRTLLHKIVGRKDGEEGSGRMTFSDDEILHQIKSLFVAGTDTTAITLAWVMYYLAKHPETFARCREEALKVAPASDGMISTPEEMSGLVFCSAVFRETVRLRTPGPLLIHTCLEDYTLKSGTIQAGRPVAFLTRRVSVSEENFTRAKEFIPERWIEAERAEALLGEGDGGEQSVRHVDDAFMGFGSGPRVCPGQDLAKTEGTMIIAAICARFDVALASGQPDPPQEIDVFTLGPEVLRLVFSRRAAR